MSLFRNLRLMTKINLLISLILFGFFLLALYGINRQQTTVAVNEAVDKARLIAAETIHVREYLSTQLLSGKVELNAGRYGLIPVVASNRVASLVASDLGYRVRQVSSRFRNPNNAPDPFEMKALERFRTSPGLHELFEIARVGEKSALRYLTPFVADESCLECHGDPQQAPAFIRELYPPDRDQSYNYTVGEVIGAASVVVPMDNLQHLIAARVRHLSLLAGGAFLVLIGGLSLLIRLGVSRPLGELGEAIRGIVRTGEFDEQLPVRGGGEIGTLIRGFNDMIESLGEKTRHLQESETRYRILTESARDSIVSFVPGGQIILFNRRAEALFGFSKLEAIGMDIGRLVHEDCESFHRLGTQAYLAEHEDALLSESRQVPMRSRDGRKITLSLTLSLAATEDYRFYTAILRFEEEAVATV